jgi:hypothetical protein
VENYSVQQQKPIEKLLNTDMTRREFLGFMGAASLGIIGVAGVIRSLQGVTGRHVDKGYGSSSYGGGRSSIGR